MRVLTCARCLKEFETEGEWRKYCPACRKAVRKEKDLRWYLSPRGQESRKRIQARRKAKAALEKELYEELPDMSQFQEETVFDAPKEHYCGHYDPTNITCINCYADTTAQYRGCYGRIK